MGLGEDLERGVKRCEWKQDVDGDANAGSGAAYPPSLRQEFARRGLTVREAYGTAELGVVAYQDEGPGLVVTDGIILEIVRPGTGVALPAGEVGEVVVTRLSADYPLFRFATGDLSCLETGPSPEGRTNMRIKGWMGRADQAAKVKGMFVRPEQVAAIARQLPDAGWLRLVVTRENEQDVMTLLVEHENAGIRDLAVTKLSEVTKLTRLVEIRPSGSLANDGKVIVDERAS